MRRLWLYLTAGLVLVFLVAPTFIVVPMSFSGTKTLRFPPATWSTRWYENYVHSDSWLQATWVSLQVGLLTVAIAVPLGVAAAYGIHSSRSRLAKALEVMVIMPLVVPVIIAAIAVFYAFAQVKLINTILGLALADTALAIPFVIITMMAGFRRFDMNQERVARSLGASPLRAFWTVSLPQLKRSVLASCVFAFFTAIDEVVIALFLSGGAGQTLTKKMFSTLRDEIEPTVAVISTGLVAISVVLLVATQLAPRRRAARPAQERAA